MLETHPTSQLVGGLNTFEEKYAPDQLFVAGRLELLSRIPRVAVIGSRKATSAGLEKARRVANIIVEREGVVVSGLAAGVDTAAHTGAIDAGGDTIAVLGTPLDKFYPRENAALQQQLMREHLVLSQFPSGYSSKGTFVMRNRTMALISHASVIIEASENSGTKHQGWEAIRLGRTLLLPQSLVEADFDWPKEMCRYGAIPFANGGELKELLDEHLPAGTNEVFGDLPF